MSADGRISYHTALALLAAAEANGSLVGAAPALDAESATMYFNWRLPPPPGKSTTTGAGGSAVQQVWIDTAATIGTKVSWGRAWGLRGVGLYQGTGAYPDNSTGSMAALYGAIRTHFVGQGGGHKKTDDAAGRSLPRASTGTKASAAGNKGMQYMSLWDYDPARTSEWINLGLTLYKAYPGHKKGSGSHLQGQIDAFKKYGVPALAYMEDGAKRIFKPGVGLGHGWEVALEARVNAIRPHFGVGKAIRGVALGGELNDTRPLRMLCLQHAVGALLPPA
jgi:hypothetical protein